MAKLDSSRLIGLKKVELTPYGETEAWIEIGDTVPDSFVITKADDTVTEEFIEEGEMAIEEIVTQKGAREISWSTKNVSGEVFHKIMGGSYANETWTENPSEKVKEFKLRATSNNGVQVVIPRISLRVTGELKFSKNALAQLTLKGKQLAVEGQNFFINYNVDGENAG